MGAGLHQQVDAVEDWNATPPTCRGDASEVARLDQSRGESATQKAMQPEQQQAATNPEEIGHFRLC